MQFDGRHPHHGFVYVPVEATQGCEEIRNAMCMGNSWWDSGGFILAMEPRNRGGFECHFMREIGTSRSDLVEYRMFRSLCGNQSRSGGLT